MAVNNLFLINAPAGSGKTFFIKEKINEILSESAAVRILCITYTERAARELKNRIISESVEIGTIHSFMNRFLSSFFKLPEVIDFYFECYNEQITARITQDSGSYAKRYKEKMGIDDFQDLSLQIVKNNIKTLYYNEMPNNTLLYGGISHDELLIFSFNLINRFPIIKLKLREKYQYIFIDEVQDTSSDILKFFYYSVMGSQTKLYLFGDKMQEIYDKYDGEFEEEFKNFDRQLSNGFPVNYRSSQEILDVLSNLYLSDLNIFQTSNRGTVGILPQLIICDSLEEYLKVHSQRAEEYLQLRTLNRHRFENNNPRKSLVEIFTIYSNIYPSYLKINVKDVLLPTNDDESPDVLLNFIFLLGDLLEHFKNKEYGELIQKLKSSYYVAEKGKKMIFNLSKLEISRHSDKQKYRTLFEGIDNLYSDGNDNPIFYLMEFLIENEIINDGFYNEIILFEIDEQFQYTDILCLPTYKFFHLNNLRNKHNISTQHGVKGEGHEKVIFVAEDSSTPGIKIYNFFKLFSQMPTFKLDDFQQFYYDFTRDLNMLEIQIEERIGKISAPKRDEYALYFESIYEKYKDNMYFQEINCQGEVFKPKLPLKHLKKMFNMSTVRSVLVAYKLFYVGCSRAERELIILVEENKIRDFSEEFIDKMRNCGFEILEFKKQK